MRRHDGPVISGRGIRLACWLAVAGMLLTSCAQWREGGVRELSSVGRSISDFFSDGSGSKRPELVGDGAETVAIQRDLRRLGYDPGEIDGVMGPRTAEAIRRYQQKRGLPADGKPTVAVRKRLAREAADAGKDGERAGRSARVAAPRKSAPQAQEAADRGNPFVPPPHYRVGTSFVYSNGAIDRVSEIEGGRVKWTGANGSIYTADRNFLLPHVYWETVTQRGRTTITHPAENSGVALWPGKVGGEVAFTVEREVVRRSGPERISRRIETWRCGNEARVALDVTAGKFDTLRFACRVGRGDGTSALLVWFYAPSVGHYVRRERWIDGEETERQDLVAMRPTTENWPPLARAGLEKDVLDALSRIADHGERAWSSRGVDAKVTLKVFSRYVGQSGESCRTYVQRWEIDGEVRLYPGAACRSGSGVWRLPVDVGDAKASLGISSGP